MIPPAELGADQMYSSSVAIVTDMKNMEGITIVIRSSHYPRPTVAVDNSHNRMSCDIELNCEFTLKDIAGGVELTNLTYLLRR